MVDLSVFAALTTSLRGASDLTKAMVDLRDHAMITSKVIDLQRIIMDAHSSTMTAQLELMALVDQVAELKAQIAESEAWRATAERYVLKDYGDGTFAYELRADVANGEPTHRLCPVCFEAQKRSILQFQHKTSSKQDLYRCTPCNSDLFLGTQHPFQQRRRQINPG